MTTPRFTELWMPPPEPKPAPATCTYTKLDPNKPLTVHDLVNLKFSLSGRILVRLDMRTDIVKAFSRDHPIIQEAFMNWPWDKVRNPEGHIDSLLGVKVFDTPWWWPNKLALSTFSDGSRRWLWLGKRQPWWFRRWFA